MLKNLLITGAAGAMGQALVKSLTEEFRGIKIIALDLDKNNVLDKLANLNGVIPADIEDFRKGQIDFSELNCVVHCAFARSQAGTALTQSIDFTRSIFEQCVKAGVPRVINISSQSIYGSFRTEPSAEDSPANPNDLYGMAKYACEQLGEVIFAGSRSRLINIRMASLVGLPYQERIINKMVKFAVENHKIRIVGGSQLFSFLHLEDAVCGLSAVIKAGEGNWKSVYNLGTDERYTIKELASVIAATVEEKTGTPVVTELEESDVKHAIPLDVSAFTGDFNWCAKVRLQDIVSEAAEFVISSNAQ